MAAVHGQAPAVAQGDAKVTIPKTPSAVVGGTAPYKPSIPQQLVLSGTSCAISTFFTNPIDMIKCRLQLQLTSGDAREYKGMIRGFGTVVRQEGFTSLWRGYNAALLRAYSYSATRLGMYEPMRSKISAELGPGFTTKLLAGVSSGTMAAVIGCPFELIKVRMQGKSYQYSNPISAMADIVRTEGAGGLWRGVVPYVFRGALLTATQLGVYDQSKTLVKEYLKVEDGILCQVSAAMTAGLVTTTICQPVDFVKTRMMNYRDLYSGPIDCIAKTARSEGLRGFYKGWVPNYARLGPHTLLTMIVYDQMRAMVGWKTI